MSRKNVIVALMWTTALSVVAFFQWGARRPREPVSIATPAVVHTADEPVSAEARARERQAVLPEGPPVCFGVDRRHTGRSAYVGPSTGVSLAWRFTTGARITAQPVIDAEGRVIVVSHDHFLYVLDPNGALAWKRDLGDAVYSTPFVDRDGSIYVGSDANMLFGFERDGRERFRIATTGDADTGLAAGPDGTLYFATGNELWAMDRNGRSRYRFRARGKIFTTPAVDDAGTAYFGAMDDHVYAVAPDGRMRWTFAAHGDVDASPLVGDDGTVYLGSDDHRFYALSPNGRLRWSIDLGGMVRANASIGRDGAIYVPVFGPRPRVVALDPSNGRVRWEFAATRTDGPEMGIRSSVLVDHAGMLFFGAHDDYVYAVTSRGELRWTYGVAGDVEATPVIAPNGTLVFASQDGSVYALRAR